MPRLGRQRAIEVAPPDLHEAPKSLVSSAARMKLDGQGWRTYRFGDDSWQQEAWRLYDIIGELHFVAGWIGSACSRVRIYVAEVDDNGRIQKETTNKKVAGLADTLFGSPPAKAEALRMLGINLTIAGDAYIVGRGTDDPESDEWFVVSCSELKRWGGNVSILWPNGEKESLDPNNDIIIRVWTPHPRRMTWADSPTRAAMPMLFEIERLTRFVFAQIDSRLISAGLFPIPKEVSFPDEDDELTGAEALTAKLMRTASASLKGEGTAAGVVPTFVEFPMEALGKLNLIQFTSELSKQALDLRKEAVQRFALAMDIDPSILSGAGEANHWGAWQIVEGQIKVHIEPLMTRICDALTSAYLEPALKSMKIKPGKYVFYFDTAPLTVRPQRLKDTLELYDKGIVSAEAVLLAGDYAISDAPDVKEKVERFIKELMLRDPGLIQSPPVRQAAGVTEEVLPSTAVIQGSQGPGGGPPPPPAPPTGIQPTPGGPIPPVAGSEAQNALPGPPTGPPTGLAAAATVPSAVTTFVLANSAVLRALEVAGKRLLDPTSRGQHRDTAPHELHTVIPVGTVDRAERVLAGAWDQLSVLTDGMDLSVDTGALRNVLDSYCIKLLVAGVPHSVQNLGLEMRERGLLDRD